MKTSLIRTMGAGALGIALAATMAACSSDSGSSGSTQTDGGTTAGETAAGGAGSVECPAAGAPIKLGFLPAWTDGLSTAYLLKHHLEDEGYEVEMEDLTEVGVLYTALAQGDVDIYPSAWPEVTHASYMERYGDDIESIGAYYDGAVLTWAVPEYSEIVSISDLPDFKDALGGRIIGIEPSAGLTEASQNSVIPAYGLDDWELVTSSTASMLAELRSKTQAGEEIVVTLWRPFWANAEFDMRDLTDPEGSLGQTESLHFLAHKGFADCYPDVAAWLGDLKLDDAEYGSLEDTVVNQYDEGQEDEAIVAWIEANPGVLPES